MSLEILRPAKKFHVDIEELIREVHHRPAIWNRSCDGYTDRRLKARMWDEVCQSIIPNWKQLKTLHQNSISGDIQKKWRNVKDAFNKEMKRLSKGTDNMKKRPYCHFKALSFLSKSYTSRRAVSVDESDEETDDTSDNQEETSNSSFRKRTRSKNEDEDESMIQVKREKFSLSDETGNGKNNKRKSDKHYDNSSEMELDKTNFENTDFSRDTTQNRDEYTNSNFVEIKCDDWDNDPITEMIPKHDKDKDHGDLKVYDEDISFTEMIIPILRRLNEDQKHFAKVEILNVLHKAKRHFPSSSCQTQTEQDQTSCDG